jgi:hypothetical protein
LGCYPDKEAAMRVAGGGSFVDFGEGKNIKGGKWEDSTKYGKHADITHHAFKTVKWTVDEDNNTLLIPGDKKGERIRKKQRKMIEKAANKMLGGVVRASGLAMKKMKHVSLTKVGVPSTPNKLPGVGHKLPNPSMKHGMGVGHRLPNPSFEAEKLKAFADYGEPMAGAMGHAHIEPNVWFTPPSLAKRGKGNHIPTDDPGEKDNKFMDVTKRNSKDTKEQRMKILKRGVPGGLPPQLPAHTTLISPHTAAYMPGMFSAGGKPIIKTRPARDIYDKRTFRAFGAAQI